MGKKAQSKQPKKSELRFENPFLVDGNERMGLIVLLFALMGKKGALGDRKKLAKMLAHGIPEGYQEKWDWKIYNAALIKLRNNGSPGRFPTSLNEESVYFQQLLQKKPDPNDGYTSEQADSDSPPVVVPPKKKPKVNTFPLNGDQLDTLQMLFKHGLNDLLRVFLVEHRLSLEVISRLRYIDSLDIKSVRKIVKHGVFKDKVLKIFDDFVASHSSEPRPPQVIIRLKSKPSVPKSSSLEIRPDLRPQGVIRQAVVPMIPTTNKDKSGPDSEGIVYQQAAEHYPPKARSDFAAETWTELSVDDVSSVRKYWESSIYSGMNFHPYESLAFLAFALWGLDNCVEPTDGALRVTSPARDKFRSWIDEGCPSPRQ